MDYVLKDRLSRLGTAVKNALEQADLRRRQRLAQAALEHQALHDSLTDLPNRLMLRDELDRTIANAIDDFGTGFSSFAYLQRLPLEEIKIDRGFVGQLASDAGSAAIVRATIELGGSLGLDVVAEGVGDAVTWQSLNRLGCSTAQGYFLSRPMPSAEVTRWFGNWPERLRGLQDTRLAA